MPVILARSNPRGLLFIILAGSALIAHPCAAQDAEKKTEEASKVASVEVTPAQAASPVGGKLEFKAVGKDAG